LQLAVFHAPLACEWDQVMKKVGLFLLGLLVIAAGCDSGPATPLPLSNEPGTQGPETTVETGTVTLKIQGPGGLLSIELSEVATGTTLEDAMRSVTQIPISIRGSGVTAFVDAIGEQKSSGSEGWVFQVDGVHAKQGVGSTVLTPPTTITWVYGDASDLVVE